MKFFKKFIRKTFRTSKKMKIKNYLREYLDSLTDSGSILNINLKTNFITLLEAVPKNQEIVHTNSPIKSD